MITRIWYPQLDVYDAVRRLCLLLFDWDNNTAPLERLYIADFYLANPPLLHKTNMPSEVRARFREIEIPKPEKKFLSYPSAPILFHKMEPIQKRALQAMAGKDIIDTDELQRGIAALSPFGSRFVEGNLFRSTTSEELKLLDFLSHQFAILSEGDTRELRKRTGLRRMA